MTLTGRLIIVRVYLITIKRPVLRLERRVETMFVQQKLFSQWQLPGEDPGKVIIGFDTEYQSNTRNQT